MKKTGGSVDGDALVAAMKGMSWESPRGPMSIDPQTGDVVHDIYIRKVEKANGELHNVEFATLRGRQGRAGGGEVEGFCSGSGAAAFWPPHAIWQKGRSERMQVIVVGGGIGGLSLALSLHQAGIAVRVYEAVRDLAPLGVGINLQPTAVRELTELGLGDELAQIGLATRN